MRITMLNIMLATCMFSMSLQAQTSQAASQRSLVQNAGNVSSDEVASGDYSPPPQSLIESRARTLGNKPDGSGTRYFAVTDLNLIGKSTAGALQSLSPTPIGKDDHVRKLYVSIELQHPWKFVTSGGQTANVGIAIVDSHVRDLEVDTTIFANSGLTVVSK